MAFSLRNLVKKSYDQVNPFDGGRSFSNQAPQPATTAQPQRNLASRAYDQANMLDGGRTFKQAVPANTQPLWKQATNNGATNAIGNTVLKPIASVPARVERAATQTAVGRGAQTVGLGAARSGIGTLQAVSGLYDLASRGTGTNRLSDALKNAAVNVDETVKAEGSNPWLYKGAQALSDGLQFAVGAGVVKAGARAVLEAPKVGAAAGAVAKVAPYIEKQVASRTANLAQKGFGGRVVATGLQNAVKPGYQASNAAFNAMQTGKEASQGQQITPAGVTTSLVAGAVALPLAGALVKQSAAPVINKATTGLRNANLIAPSRLSSQEVTNLSTFSNQARSGNMMDDVTYNNGVTAANKAGIDYRDPNAVDNLVGAHRTYDVRVAERPKLQLQPLNSAGTGKVPISGKAAEFATRNNQPTPSAAPSTKLVPQSPRAAVTATPPPATQAVVGRSGSLGNDTGLPIVGTPIRGITKPAESNFPLRVMTDERADPIRPILNKLATHEVKTNQSVLDQTASKIASDEDAALAFARRGTSTEANATGMQLLNKYLQEGSMDKAGDLLQTISPRFTRQGQETQILAAFSKLHPAGAVKYAAREIEKASPRAARLEDETLIASKTIRTTAKEIATQIENEIRQGSLGKKLAGNTIKGAKSPEEMLANRIKASSPKNAAESDPVKDMVNTLHKVAKELLPAKGKTIPRDPMQLIGQAIRDKAGYADIYEKAQVLVAKKYADNPAALAELDKYFNSQLSRPFSTGQLNQGVKQQLKGTDLGKIVKEHYTKVDETGAELKQKLIQRAGLNDQEATQLASDIQKRYDVLVQVKKDSIIKQMFGTKPTPKQISDAERIITMTNLGALGRDELRPLVAQKLKIPTLTPQAATEITKRANALQLLPENSQARFQATAEMMQFIGRQVPSSAVDKLSSAWTAGLISGAKTVTGAPVSNATNATLGLGSNPIAAGLDAARTAITGAPRSNTLVSPMNYVKGFASGLPKSKEYLKTGIDERGPVGTQRETNYKSKKVGSLVNGTFRVMAALDRPFYYGQKAQSQAEVAKLNRMNKGKPAREVSDSEIVEQDARQSVLDFDTMLSTGAGALKQAFGKNDDAFSRSISKVAMTANAPFVRIPSAALARMIDYSPAGAPLKAVRQAANMKWGNQREFNWRDMNKAIGESTTGTGLVVLGYQLAQSDNVSGAYPKEAKEVARWETEKIQANSVKIGGTWVSLNYFGPVGSLLSQGKRFAESQKLGDSKAVSFGKAEGGVFQDATNQSYLQGLNKSLKAIDDPEKSLGNYAKGLAGTIVPSAVNDVATATDKSQRQVNDGKDAVLNRLPVFRTILNEKQDVYGDTLKRKTNAITGIFNPARASDSVTSPVRDEVRRLHLVDKNKTELQVTPTAQGKKVSVNGKDVKLSTQQRYDLQKAVGQATNKAWGSLITTPEYKAADDLTKAAMLTKAKNTATEVPERTVVIKNNLGTYNKPAGKAAVAYESNQSNIAKLSKVSTGSTGSTTTLNANLDTYSKKVLDEYDTLDAATKKKKAYGENDYDFKVASAKYKNDTANTTMSKAQQVNRLQAMQKAEVGKAYSKDTRELHGLTENELADLLESDKNGKTTAASLIAYDKALTASGIQKKDKFKGGYIARTGTGSGSGSRGGKGSRGGRAKGSFDYAKGLGITYAAGASNQTALRNLIGKNRITARKANVKTVTLKRKAR